MKTVKVKIAVEVNANGQWQAVGGHDYNHYTNNTFYGCDVGDPSESVFFWVEAELPVPTPRDPASFPVYRGVPTLGADLAANFFKNIPEDEDVKT